MYVNDGSMKSSENAFFLLCLCSNEIADLSHRYFSLKNFFSENTNNCLILGQTNATVSQMHHPWILPALFRYQVGFRPVNPNLCTMDHTRSARSSKEAHKFSGTKSLWSHPTSHWALSATEGRKGTAYCHCHSRYWSISLAVGSVFSALWMLRMVIAS